MPGRSQAARGAFLVGLAAAVVGLVGYVVFGWRFGDGGNGVSTGLGVLVAALAIAVTLYRYAGA